MNLSYSIRLLLLCLASFFLVHAIAGLAVRLALGPTIRFAERLNATAAARLLLAMRFLPFAVAVISVLGVCAPSYLRFEENLLVERVGLGCLALGGLGVLICLSALDKGLRLATSSLEFSRLCRASGHTVRLRGKPSQMLVIPGPRLFLAQAGIFRPSIVISQRLLREFSSKELAAALNHERAHWLSRDNLKRLLIAFLPDVLPLVPTFKALERDWAKFAERAADDYVLAAGPEYGLSLASALVRLARLGTAASLHDWDPLPVSALGSSNDFANRVDRLLKPESEGADIALRLCGVFGGSTLFVACCVAAAVWSSALSPIHEFLELLIR